MLNQSDVSDEVLAVPPAQGDPLSGIFIITDLVHASLILPLTGFIAIIRKHCYTTNTGGPTIESCGDGQCNHDGPKKCPPTALLKVPVTL